MIISNRGSASDAAPLAYVPRLAALFAVVIGGIAAIWYWRAGLTLSHYDAKAHLVVARRVIDSLTPGWEQIGAIWLPLPHLLNLLPVQIDLFYRTGWSAVALSIASFGIAAHATAALLVRATGAPAAALAGVGLLILNPNLLYLQATPMTEPLLLGLTLVAIAHLHDWIERDAIGSPRVAGLALAGACLTRYEAWPITASALALTGIALIRRGQSVAFSLDRTARLAAYPALAIVGFLCLSRATVGEWFLMGGFFAPDNPVTGRPFGAVLYLVGGINRLAGVLLTSLAAGAAFLVAIRGLGSRRRAPAIVTLALAASAAVAWYGFYAGHPFRIRYMVPLIGAVVVGCGLAVGALPSRAQLPVASILLAISLLSTPPFDSNAPMVAEAKLDLPASAARTRVTQCLSEGYKGEKILASMGSLAHYMQETAGAGFRIADFIHEGNGDLWTGSLASPGRYAGWVLIEEVAEGGDMLADRARRQPTFLEGYERVCEGGGVALYQRRPES